MLFAIQRNKFLCFVIFHVFVNCQTLFRNTFDYVDFAIVYDAVFPLFKCLRYHSNYFYIMQRCCKNKYYLCNSNNVALKFFKKKMKQARNTTAKTEILDLISQSEVALSHSEIQSLD